MISLTELNINKKDLAKECSVIEYNNINIKVFKYIPLSDKIDLIYTALQNSKDSNGVYNIIKLNAEFHLNIVLMYTDIVLFDENTDTVYSREETYDFLKASGLLNLILSAIDKTEYSNLCELMEEQKKEYTEYNKSIIGLLKTAIEQLPQNTEQAVEMLKGIDLDKFKSMMDSINLGRIE